MITNRKQSKKEVETEGIILNIAERMKVSPNHIYKEFYKNLPIKERYKFKSPRQFNNFLRKGRIHPLYKTLSNKDFVRDKGLVKKFGKYGDWDRDGIPNWKDCKPFNYQEQGILSSIGKAVSSAVSKAVSTVKSTVSNIISGGSNKSSGNTSTSSGSSSSSSSSSKSSSSSSSGGGSSGGTYNKATQTYTDSSGNKMSMSQENATKLGAKVETTSKDAKGVQSGSGGASKETIAIMQKKASSGANLSSTETKEQSLYSALNKSNYGNGLPNNIFSNVSNNRSSNFNKKSEKSQKGFWGESGDKEGRTYVLDEYGNVLGVKEYGWTPSQNNANDFYGKEQVYLKNEKDSKFDYYSKKYLPRFVEQVPIIVKNIAVDTGKGFTQAGLYAIDEATAIANIRKGENGLYIDKSKIPVSKWKGDSIAGKIRDWSNYNFEKSPFLSPEYQTAGITTAFAGAGALAGLGGKAGMMATRAGQAGWLGMTGYQGYQTLKNPTDENIAMTGLMVLPEVNAKFKKARGRSDVFLADKGELVPLKNRMSQIKYALDNAGKEIEMITSKPSKKAKFTNIKDVKNPDYTFGNKIEFGTYKVGDVYPTSEYFLGKGNKLQRFFKQERVNIEKVNVAETNNIFRNQIEREIRNKGRVSENLIKEYYKTAKREANILGEPVAVISPKRLRGFWQAEQELVKIIPDGYKGKSLKFSGWTEKGQKIFSEDTYLSSLGKWAKSKFKKGKVESSYWDELAKEKQEYLAGGESMKGEYARHGMEHLKPMEQYNPLYKEHDIMKVGDTDSFSKFPHGETAQEWAIRKGIDPKMAEAYGGHEYVRFDPRMLFIEPNKKGMGSITIPNWKQLKWTVKETLRPNTYLQDVATLDRLDLTRFGITADERFLSKEALQRLFGERAKEIVKEANKQAENVNIRKAEIETKIKKGTATESEIQWKSEVEKAKDSYASQGGESTYYKNAREIYDPYTKYVEKETGITGDYEYKGKEDYNIYPEKGNDYGRKYDKKELSEEKGEYKEDDYYKKKGYGKITGKEYGGNKRKKIIAKIRRGLIPVQRKAKDAWQPIMLNQDGKYIEGDMFETYTGAVNEGMIATDELPETEFTIRKIKVPEYMIKQARNANVHYKFQYKNGVWKERSKYMKDRPREGNFNWMGYLKASYA